MHIIEKSLEIALKSHIGQSDKAGKPYILHPLRLMMKMTTDEEKSAAVLHDVIEDSECTAEDLLKQGIPATVVDAVSSLTKKEGEDYEAFVERVLNKPLAARIKKADIEDNLNVLRLDGLSSKDLQRVAKYHKAWKRLESF